MNKLTKNQLEEKQRQVEVTAFDIYQDNPKDGLNKAYEMAEALVGVPRKK